MLLRSPRQATCSSAAWKRASDVSSSALPASGPGLRSERLTPPVTPDTGLGFCVRAYESASSSGEDESDGGFMCQVGRDWALEQEAAPHRHALAGREYMTNEAIRAGVVRVLGGDGGKEMKGIMSRRDALYLAQEAGVDLVLLNSEAHPPLCRLVEWSKFKYEVEKERKMSNAKAATPETKEVRLRPHTDTGDLQTKLRSTLRFLDKGHRVKLSMKFEGRELLFKQQGLALLQAFIDDVGQAAWLEGVISWQAGTCTCLLGPSKRSHASGCASAPLSSKPAQPYPGRPAPPSLPASDPPKGNMAAPDVTPAPWGTVDPASGTAAGTAALPRPLLPLPGLPTQQQLLQRVLDAPIAPLPWVPLTRTAITAHHVRPGAPCPP